MRPEFRNDLLQESRVPRNVIGEFGDEVLGSGLFRRLVHVEAEPAEVPEVVGHFLHLLPVAAVLELHAGGGGLLRVLHVLLDAREVGCGRVAEGDPLEEVAFGLVLDAVSVLGHENILQRLRRDAVHVGSAAEEHDVRHCLRERVLVHLGKIPVRGGLADVRGDFPGAVVYNVKGELPLRGGARRGGLLVDFRRACEDVVVAHDVCGLESVPLVRNHRALGLLVDDACEAVEDFTRLGTR